jgi:hypothetical protein
MLTEGEFADLCRGLYLDLRGGVVDRESAFDLSVAVLAENPADDEAAKVAALALDDDADDATLAAAVRELLVYRYAAPGRWRPGRNRQAGRVRPASTARRKQADDLDRRRRLGLATISPI